MKGGANERGRSKSKEIRGDLVVGGQTKSARGKKRRIDGDRDNENERKNRATGSEGSRRKQRGGRPAVFEKRGFSRRSAKDCDRTQKRKELERQRRGRDGSRRGRSMLTQPQRCWDKRVH